MKCLVTGGAGFIGSNLVRALLAENITVRVIDNFSTGKRANLAGLEDDVEIFEGDINDLDFLLSTLQGITYVFHQAALPSVRRSVENPLASNANNINGTLNVLWAALKAGVKRVIYASSSSVYGDTPVLPKVESMPANPQSPYALSKYCGEIYCRLFSEIYGLETVALRYFNVFGPYQDPTSEYSAVIPKFIHLMKQHQSPIIYGTGEQTRDFCYVENVVTANLLAMSCSLANGQGINIGCHERISLLQLVDALNDLLGTDISPTFLPAKKGDIQHSLADIQLAQDRLGYSPTVRVRDGLEKLVSWCNNS